MLIDLFDILCGTKKSIVIDAKLVKGSNYSNKYIVTWDFDREVFLYLHIEDTKFKLLKSDSAYEDISLYDASKMAQVMLSKC